MCSIVVWIELSMYEDIKEIGQDLLRKKKKKKK
jgi:hypothetical protein